VELELESVEGSNVGPTRTPKGAHAGIIWLFLKQDLKGGGEIKDFGRKSID
jgi:hypothetical protein